MRTAPARPRAFTLVELLVVVGIIGILISILLPSLASARRLARRTECLARIRDLFQANTVYLMEQRVFPPLNNEEDDGRWQYNYLIYDGRDFNSNFGPLLHGEYVADSNRLYCPLQTDPFHQRGTEENPWPYKEGLDTRSSYARRYHLSGKSFAKLNCSIGVFADIMHLPKVVLSGHGIGLNAVYGDGHGTWVPDPGILTHNDLAHPFDPLDNPIVKDIWDAIERAL